MESGALASFYGTGGHRLVFREPWGLSGFYRTGTLAGFFPEAEGTGWFPGSNGARCFCYGTDAMHVFLQKWRPPAGFHHGGWVVFDGAEA